jgi:YesN/AraC family two-component response regulator
VHCIENVENSYTQAIHTLAYRFVKGKGALINYKDIEACDKEPIKLPSQFTEELSEAIRQKNKKQVQAVLDKTYAEWFENRQLSMFQAQSLYFFIINIAMGVLDEINIDLTAMAGEGLSPLDALTACETIGEVFTALADILTTACEYSSTISKRDHLVKTALSYITQNFFRMDFSQTLLADALNVTPTYLSRVIKAVTGRNMVDILNEIRIEKAKELLMDQDRSLSSIAEAVGIGSVKSLIRVFKQHTGMTPGRMRELALREAKHVTFENDK